MSFYKRLSLIFLSIFCFHCGSPITHKVVDYFENGNMKTLEISNGLSIIQKVQFSERGNILKRSFYQDGHFYAEWTSGDFFRDEDFVQNYYSNGVLKNQGYIVDDQMHGNWSHYSRYGELESNRYYFYGEPVDDWYSYHDGYTDVVSYGNIKGIGHWIEYYNNGQVRESTFFHNKQISGIYQSYYKSGTVKVEGSYLYGKKHGKWTHYNSLGKMIKIENYKEGSLDGDFNLFFDDGITEKLIGRYKNNKRFETWFWFFDQDKKSNLKINYSK